MSTKNLLELKDLSVRFHTDDGVVDAVKNVDISIGKGEVVGLVGESGSGKTVTAQSIVRLVPTPPAEYLSGQINFQGKDLRTLPIEQLRDIRGHSIGMIFQEPMTALSPLQKIGRQILEVQQLHEDIDNETAWQRAVSWLDKVGLPPPLEERMYAYPHELSGGMRQRVMIAMALIHEPDLIIADEPTTALDVTIQNQVFRLLMQMKNNDTSLLLITHDMAVVWELCDRIYVMQNAQVVESGKTEDIFKNPTQEYTRLLLDSVPRLYEEGEHIGPGSGETDEPVISDETSLIKVKNLRVWFPVRQGIFSRTVDHVKAVEDVSLYINPGETLGLVGESGSGKTTLGRAIVGLQENYSGSVFYEGTEITSLSNREKLPYRRNMQMIFQDPFSSLNPRMTVMDILTEGLMHHKLLTGSKKDKAAELLDDVGLDADMMNRYPFEFSGGQRQRISIARALSLEPSFIVCDEAVSALDVSIQAQVIGLLKSLQIKFAITYLFITHDLSVVRQIADRIAVMHFGKIIEYGTTDEVILSPSQEYTRELLEAVPVPGSMERRQLMRGDINVT